MASSYDYEKITAKILDALNQDRIPWRRSWSNMPSNAVTGHAYTGINLLLLADTSFTSSHWLTYNQAKDNGGNVRRGEKGQTVVFWKMLRTEVETDNGDKKIKTIPLLKTYTVFNIDQCDGLDKLKEKLATKQIESMAEPQSIVDGYAMGPAIEFKGCQPCYRPSRDVVEIPDKSHFDSSESYYSVLFHELTHSTGHESRLNRLTKRASFGDDNYSLEELVAEIGSAFLCAKSGIEAVTNNTKAYIQSWISALRNDPKMIVVAASRAQKAVDLITG